MENLPALVDVTGPSCATCPFAWDAEDGHLYCRRLPPISADVPVPVAALPKAQQLTLPAEVLKQGIVMTRQSRFPVVLPTMLCGEHPDFPLEDEEPSKETH